MKKATAMLQNKENISQRAKARVTRQDCSVLSEIHEKLQFLKPKLDFVSERVLRAKHENSYRLTLRLLE